MNRRTWILAAILLALPACESDSTGANASIAGTYSIQTRNGNALPQTTDGEVLTAGTLQLKSDNTWNVTFIATFVGGGDATFRDNGTYTYIDGDLALKSATDQAVTHGTFSGTTLTVQGDDGIYVLKKN